MRTRAGAAISAASLTASRCRGRMESRTKGNSSPNVSGWGDALQPVHPNADNAFPACSRESTAYFSGSTSPPAYGKYNSCEPIQSATEVRPARTMSTACPASCGGSVGTLASPISMTVAKWLIIADRASPHSRPPRADFASRTSRVVGNTPWWPATAVANRREESWSKPCCAESSGKATAPTVPWGASARARNANPASLSLVFAAGHFCWNPGDALPMSCAPAQKAIQWQASSSSRPIWPASHARSDPERLSSIGRGKPLPRQSGGRRAGDIPRGPCRRSLASPRTGVPRWSLPLPHLAS